MGPETSNSVCVYIMCITVIVLQWLQGQWLHGVSSFKCRDHPKVQGNRFVQVHVLVCVLITKPVTFRG